MVQTLATNSSNDLFVNASGSLTMLSGVAAVAAACVTACLTQLGECVLQTDVGLPNFGLIWVGTPDYALWQSYLQNTILNVQGVTSVQQIQLLPRDNTLTFRAAINTIYGPTTINGAVSA
jgi:hypothetical protein